MNKWVKRHQNLAEDNIFKFCCYIIINLINQMFDVYLNHKDCINLERYNKRIIDTCYG